MKHKLTWFLTAMSFLVILALSIAGCSTATPPKGGTADGLGKSSVAAAQPILTGGAELWGRNCGHCHNIRSPSSYSDAQWEVVMLHMRVRANLTADEHKKILAFLKSAH
jgi:cytochrome c5